MAMSRAWIGTLTASEWSNTRWSAMVMAPADGVSSPATLRSVEVFPQPLGPSSVKNSPVAMSSDTPRTDGCAAPG